MDFISNFTDFRYTLIESFINFLNTTGKNEENF